MPSEELSVRTIELTEGEHDSPWFARITADAAPRSTLMRYGNERVQRERTNQAIFDSKPAT